MVFLEELEKNNNKAWFEENRAGYADAAQDFLGFFDSLAAEIASFDSGVAETMEVSRKIFRIHRDVRFSRDKTPYKAQLSGAIVPGGMKSGLAGYYVQVRPGGRSMAAGGLHEAESKALHRVRSAIFSRFGEFKAIVESEEFKKEFGGIEGDTLKRVPKEFDARDPAAQYLKMKTFMARNTIPDEVVLSDAFHRRVVGSFRVLKILNDFLNDALSEGSPAPTSGKGKTRTRRRPS